MGTDKLNMPRHFYTLPFRYGMRASLVGVVQGKHGVTGRLCTATNREGNGCWYYLDRLLTASITNITNSKHNYGRLLETLTIKEGGPDLEEGADGAGGGRWGGVC